MTFVLKKLFVSLFLRDEERGDYLLDFAAEYAAGQWSCVDGGKYTLIVALAKKPAVTASFPIPIPTQEERK